MATSHIPVVSREGDRGAPSRGVNGDACPTLPGAPGLPRGLCPAWAGAGGLALAHAGAPTPEPDPVPHGARSASCMPACTSGGGLETPDLLWLPNWHLGDPGPQPVRGPLAHSQLPGWGGRESQGGPSRGGASGKGALTPHLSETCRAPAWLREGLGDPWVTGKDQDLTSGLVLPAFSAAGPSRLQMPLRAPGWPG